MFLAKILLVCAAVVLVSGTSLGGLGAPRQLTGEDLEQSKQSLQNSLNKLATGEGPNYRISKILSASYQVVAGSLETYNVELIDSNNVTKVCNVQIWSRSWLANGIEVTFNCPNEETVVRKHNP